MLDINKYKGLMAHIYLKNGKAVTGFHHEKPSDDGDVLSLAKYYEQHCADAVIVFNLASKESEHKEHLTLIETLNKELKIPVIAGGNIRKTTDIDELLHVGCRHVFLNMSKPENLELLKSACNIFGKEVLAVWIKDFNTSSQDREHFEKYSSFALLEGDDHHLYDAVRSMQLQCIPILENIDNTHTHVLLNASNVMGISGEILSNKNVDIYNFKERLLANGIQMHYREAEYKWEDLKLNSDGMIPVIVQDYKNNQVLMMAYMDEEAYNRTVRTGIMSYHSRSRDELWIKGETSGHYQHVKELFIDCDMDTILAKVEQIGAACHTGSRTCFYRSMQKTSYKDLNPASVLGNLYQDIKMKKNYPDKDRILSDTSNLMYYLTGVLAKNDITWDEVAEMIYDRQENV